MILIKGVIGWLGQFITAFEKKLALIKELVTERSYRESFYQYTESLLKKYNITEMNESQLDGYLHT